MIVTVGAFFPTMVISCVFEHAVGYAISRTSTVYVPAAILVKELFAPAVGAERTVPLVPEPLYHEKSKVVASAWLLVVRVVVSPGQRYECEGVMVTQLVLVQSFKVRILIGQHRKTQLT